MEEFMQGCLSSIIIFLILILFSFILTYPEMLLWNWLMPKFFGVPTITFWEMFGLDVLLAMLIPHSTNYKN